EASTLFNLMSNPILTSLEYIQCEAVFFVSPTVLLSFLTVIKKCIILLYQLRIYPEEIIESLIRMAYFTYDQSPNHLKLFGLIKKKATASPSFNKIAPLINLFSKNDRNETLFQTLLAEYNSSNISLMDLVDKHNHKFFNDDKLVPFMGVFDSFTLYSGVKLSNSREPKNEAFDL
ncbi:hypothetical protein MXB_819, partial [Myxobolus squamalis]